MQKCKSGTTYQMNIPLFSFSHQSEYFKFKTVYFYCFERILFFGKINVEGKVVYGEHLSSEKIVRRGKLSSEKNICQLIKISSFFPDEVFPDKVLFKVEILIDDSNYRKPTTLPNNRFFLLKT